ncbi:hypothetical protein ACYOEI_33030 [Singulisphaera rosea]
MNEPESLRSRGRRAKDCSTGRPAGRRNARRLGGICLPLIVLALGCGITPKNFRALNNPAAITRARSVGLGGKLPDWKVIPPLIDRLEDPDPVVRLSAHEELKRRTGQDFGYIPWAQPGERGVAIAKWREWWGQQKPDLARNRQNP